MLFNSIAFVIFFPLVLVVYYLLPKNEWRTWFLLAASYYFYMSLNPLCALILLGCTIVTWTGGIAMESQRCEDRKIRKRVATLTVILNVAILAVFKYTNFLGDSLLSVFNFVSGEAKTWSGFNIILPVGVSFYVFKAVSYVCDIYSRKISAERNFHLFALYVAFFPQLLAGPIERAGRLIPQFKRKIDFDGSNVSAGLKMMLWGYFMKLVFADRATIFVDTIYGNLHVQSGTTILLAAILYSFQIYCDFAGYSLISIGVSKAMGYEVMANFSRPYMAGSITEFWKRWHMSLTRWLVDYVYIPLGGSRCSKLKNYRNIMVTFLVSGLWHGAAWNFVVWGGMHGIIQIIEKYLGIAKVDTKRVAVNVMRIFVTFMIATFAWMFFRLPNFGDAAYGIGRIFTSFSFTLGGLDTVTALEYCAIGLIFILTKDVLDEYFPGRFNLFDNKSVVVRYVAYVCTCLLILTLGVFDDSQFIYMQF